MIWKNSLQKTKRQKLGIAWECASRNSLNITTSAISDNCCELSMTRIIHDKNFSFGKKNTQLVEKKFVLCFVSSVPRSCSTNQDQGGHVTMKSFNPPTMKRSVVQKCFRDEPKRTSPSAYIHAYLLVTCSSSFSSSA